MSALFAKLQPGVKSIGGRPLNAAYMPPWAPRAAKAAASVGQEAYGTMKSNQFYSVSASSATRIG